MSSGLVLWALQYNCRVALIIATVALLADGALSAHEDIAADDATH
jgi:hypothetical protein